MNPIKVIHPSWTPIIGMLYIEPLKSFKDNVLPNCAVSPYRSFIFNVLSMPVKDIKVVVIGQDPYPNPEMATGYSFAIPPGIRQPPSLQVIQQEVINSDPSNMNGSGKIDMLKWKDQGVFLLNAALTCEIGNSGSHLEYWRLFTQRIVDYISQVNPCIWILWGKNADGFKQHIVNRVVVDMYNKETIDSLPIAPNLNYILTAAHPMAERYKSGKFYGCDHFYKVNRILSQRRLDKIKW